MTRILIVEDSPAMRTYVRAALEGAPEVGDDVEIVEASNGFEALRLLPRGPYDLVITDINMPDINGLELIRFVRQSQHLRAVPLFVISTQSSERDMDRALKLGADAFLAKPFTPEMLREKVAESIRAAREGAADRDAAGHDGGPTPSKPGSAPHSSGGSGV